MAKAKVKRIETLKKKAQDEAGKLGHVLGEWKETITPNVLHATCTKCAASARIDVSRHGGITGDAIGTPGQPALRCRGFRLR